MDLGVGVGGIGVVGVGVVVVGGNGVGGDDGNDKGDFVTQIPN